MRRAAYLLILTYDRSANAADHITIVHFTGSLINPVPSMSKSMGRTFCTSWSIRLTPKSGSSSSRSTSSHYYATGLATIAPTPQATSCNSADLSSTSCYSL